MYPEAKMIASMKVWKLPVGKEDKLSEVCSSGEYFLEEKIDGHWYEFEKTENYSYFFSRSTSTVTGCLSEKSGNVPHIMAALDCMPSNTILIGEVYYPGGTSKTVATVMGCLAEEAVKRQENNPIHYYLHDIIEYNGINLMDCGAEERYDILQAVWKVHNLGQYDFLRLATKVEDNFEEEIAHILGSGGEGVVLKKRNYPYVPDKRPAWSTIKVKQMDSIDLVCCGFCPPTKDYTGKDIETWPYWERFTITENGETTDLLCEGNHYQEYKQQQDGYSLVEYYPITKYYYYGWNTAIEIGAYDSQGNLVKLGTVSSGLTDDMKQRMTERPQDYLYKVVSLGCMSIDKKERTLRHPTLKAWREDKDAKDCLIEEIFA